ncbi:hypothetical protein [Caulobacter sp. 17J65-9]|uniref:hypothetical protein n=1 Tax=Caulobacter sp. 17J65-9 TaxID=2709382 RepID=UPI0013C9DEBC|nr:hypothetical protein [Caulobacter sp. 17J65-9]NEX94094.1 hypothetical protein [Caulobacter sp. 17J65-9]
MSFSISHTGLEGFRLIGRRPVSVALWALVMLVFCAAIVALFLAVAWPTLAALDGLKDETLGHAEALRLFGPLALAVAAVLPVALVMKGVLLAALFRAVLKPEKVGFGFLRLGGDELRQVVVALLQSLIAIVLVFGPVFAIVHLDLAFPFTAGQWAAAVLGCVAAFLLYVWVGVRLSLAGPMTLAAGRVRFWKSWTLTRGRFWPLLAMFLLANIVALVIYFVGDMVTEAALAAFGVPFHFSYDTDQLPHVAELTLTSKACIGLGVYFLLQMVLAAVQFVVAYAPAAGAYRDLTAAREA